MSQRLFVKADLCSNSVIAGRILVFFEYFFIPVTMFMFTVFLLHCGGENWRKSKNFYYSIEWKKFIPQLFRQPNYFFVPMPD